MRRQTIDRLVVLGYIAAVSMPPIGFVLALVIAFRDTHANLKHALLIFALGLIACVLWALAISSGALTATDSSV
jgi:4-amino-4-deoxy-L-arabinose transferase-like glycosyltransferase